MNNDMKILSSEITSYSTYINRRAFVKNFLAASFVFSTSNFSYASHDSNLDNLTILLGKTSFE